MRYYTVTIAGLDEKIWPPRYENGAVWGSHVNGVADPGAQQVEFHIEEFRPNQPTADSTLTVHGVSWEQIRYTDQLIGKPITIVGGMAPGLPLATLQSRRRGLLLQARIFRAWGNWIGTDMSIGLQFQAAGNSEASGGGGDQGSGGTSSGGESGGSGGSTPTEQMITPNGTRVRWSSRKVGFRSLDKRPYPRGASAPFGSDIPIVSPSGIGDIGQFGGNQVFGAATNIFGDMASSLFGGGSQGLKAPLNLIHNMMPNMPLSSAISETLGKAFPQGGSRVAISDALKLGYQDAGMYQNMEQYAGYIQKLSQSIMGIKNYPGVQMSSKDNTMKVWDTTKSMGQGDILFYELIGQPTWIALNTIQVKCMLRGDIECGMTVSLPATMLTTLSPEAILGSGQNSASPQRSNVSIDGSGFVINVLHIGDFRNPDGVGWSTTYDIYVSGSGGGTGTQFVEDGSGLGIPGGVPNIPNLPTLQMAPPSRLLARGRMYF